MKKILVFGTGGAAEKFMANAGGIYDVVGFADNDPKKHGKLFHGRRIFAPSEIASLQFDQIIVASMWFADIQSQLVEQCGVNPDLVRHIPKIFTSPGKRYRPFEDDPTRAFAGRVLRHVCSFLEDRSIPCYVDHGTLLGLVRDNGLMPWDDDLDLSVADSDRHRLCAAIPDLLASMPEAGRIEWKVDLIHNSIDDVVALFMTVVDPSETINVFNAGISFFSFQNDLAVEAINWAPASHYAGGEWIESSLGPYRAPNRFEDYLALHYGNWRTPVKDMSFGQIDNFKRREAPAHWVAWDPSAAPSPEPQLDALRADRIHGSRLFVLASRPNPSPGLQRIPADLPALEQSLAALAKNLFVDVAVVCGADPAEPGNLRPVLDALRRSGVAEKIHVEMGLDALPCPEVLAAMESVSAERAFHRKTLNKPKNPPVFDSPSCTAPMRNAIRQFRCRYKKRWLLWNDLLALCPKALELHLAGADSRVQPDLLSLSPSDPALKQRLLALFRNRPCAAAADCPSDDGVWEPFAVYPFTRSQFNPTRAGDNDD